MTDYMRMSWLATVAGLATAVVGCVPTAKPNAAGIVNTGEQVFAILPVESVGFPQAAKVTTEHLRRARIRGLPPPQASKVALEVVQLSIECVDPSPTCYQAVGRTLEINQLLFAQLAAGTKQGSVKVTVTLFDVDAGQLRRTATKVFGSEEDVAYGIAAVVGEATKP